MQYLKSKLRRIFVKPHLTFRQAIVKRDDVTGIVGMDLTLGYIYKLVLRTSPLCHDVTVRCFLFDDDGYLIVHPGTVSPKCYVLPMQSF